LLKKIIRLINGFVKNFKVDFKTNFSLNEIKSPHLSITLLATLILVANFYSSNVEANFESDINLLELYPDQTSKTIESVASYTALIDENVDELASEIALNGSYGYLGKDSSVITEASKLETEYVVQKGDTISGIANKFNMHVASIADRNSIGVDSIENLHPGQKLIIPSTDTSSSQDWLAQLNAKKEKERQLVAKKAAEQKAKLAASKRTTITRERAGSGYDGEGSSGWINPTSYKYISRGIQKGHLGIDMVTNVGTPVYAAKAGKVIEITRNWGSGYGNSVLIDHGGGQTSRYAHLSAFEVGTGDDVNQGQLIAKSGNTGWSTGPHLHFEVRINGRAVNPFK